MRISQHVHTAQTNINMHDARLSVSANEEDQSSECVCNSLLKSTQQSC